MQVFDVVNFDMMTMLKLPYVPQCAAWIYKVRQRHLVMPICRLGIIPSICSLLICQGRAFTPSLRAQLHVMAGYTIQLALKGL